MVTHVGRRPTGERSGEQRLEVHVAQPARALVGHRHARYEEGALRRVRALEQRAEPRDGARLAVRAPGAPGAQHVAASASLSPRRPAVSWTSSSRSTLGAIGPSTSATSASVASRPSAVRTTARPARARPGSARTASRVEQRAHRAPRRPRRLRRCRPGPRPRGSGTTARSHPQRRRPGRAARTIASWPAASASWQSTTVRREPLELVAWRSVSAVPIEPDRLRDAGLAQRDDVRVALDEHDPPRAGRRPRARGRRRRPCWPLWNSSPSRRVEVLRALVVAPAPARRTRAPARARSRQREHDPAAEAVETPGRRGERCDEPGRQQLLLGVARPPRGDQHLSQRAGA